jgi:DNA-binding transcriptional regulator YiaG
MGTLIEQLREMIQGRFPEARLALDRPKNPQASWWLDLSVGDQEATVEWRPQLGFGVSARPDAVFGERADEVYESLDDTFNRIKQLILSRTTTSAPQEMSLADLRRHREISQEELAQRLAIRQASVSKMERREDLLLGTLKSMVHAMGGVLEIRAHFHDEVIRIQFERADEPSADRRTNAA